MQREGELEVEHEAQTQDSLSTSGKGSEGFGIGDLQFRIQHQSVALFGNEILLGQCG